MDTIVIAVVLVPTILHTDPVRALADVVRVLRLGVQHQALGPASGRGCGNEQMWDAASARLRHDIARRYAETLPVRPALAQGSRPVDGRFAEELVRQMPRPPRRDWRAGPMGSAAEETTMHSPCL